MPGLRLRSSASGSEASAGPGLWPWVVWLVAFCWLWWPGGLEFRSDDYLAVAYVQEPARVLHDFVGSQYSVPRVALFYRPLITLSIALDSWLGGSQSFVPLFANSLVHLANSVLVFLVLRRFVAAWPAFFACCFWSLHPGWGEAVSWVVGRVDVHATFFYLLSIHLDLLAREGRLKTRWPVLIAFFLGGITKEVCLTLPGALFLLRAPTSGVRRALFDIVPYLAVLVVLLVIRLLTLGEAVGGYEAATFRVAPLLGVWEPLVPREMRPPWNDGLTLRAIYVALLVVAAGGIVAVRARRRGLALLLGAGLFVVASLPSAGAAGATKPERYNYLPAVALAGVAALGGPFPPLLLLLAHAPAAFDERRILRELSTDVRHVRDETDRLLAAPSSDPVFVDAPANARGRVLFAVGADRLALPPFGAGEHTLLPKRALFPQSDLQRREALLGAHEPFYRGPAPLDAAALVRINQGESARLGLENVRAKSYVVTVATSVGWIRAAVGAGESGDIGVRDLLAAEPLGLRQRGLVLEIWPAVELSASPEPWIHLEARNEAGEVIARCRRWLRLPLRRDLWQALNKPKRRELGILLLVAVVTLSLAVWAAKAAPGPEPTDRGSREAAS